MQISLSALYREIASACHSVILAGAAARLPWPGPCDCDGSFMVSDMQRRGCATNQLTCQLMRESMRPALAVRSGVLANLADTPHLQCTVPGAAAPSVDCGAALAPEEHISLCGPYLITSDSTVHSSACPMCRLVSRACTPSALSARLESGGRAW